MKFNSLNHLFLKKRDGVSRSSFTSNCFPVDVIIAFINGVVCSQSLQVFSEGRRIRKRKNLSSSQRALRRLFRQGHSSCGFEKPRHNRCDVAADNYLYMFLGARNSRLKILIVGAGQNGMEALKTASWCGQTSQEWVAQNPFS